MIIISRADVSIVSGTSKNALHYAIERGDIDIINSIIDAIEAPSSKEKRNKIMNTKNIEE